MSIKWIEVNKQNPCPICEHTSWCSVSSDYNHVCCRRGDGGGLEKTDKSGGIYWYYNLSNDKVDYLTDNDSDPPVRADSSRAAPEVLNEVYTALLSELTLSKAHFQNLLERGLGKNEIQLRNYKSLPLQGRSRLVKFLKGKFGEKIFHVPGIYREEKNGKAWSTLAGSPGLLIPVRDIQERIVGLKIRVDDPGNSNRKYTWLSSSGRPGGTGQINLVHFPFFLGDKKTVRITEGELKGDISTVLSGIWTWSLPGVNSWRLALPALQELEIKNVIVAFDADSRKNRTVANHLVMFLEELHRLKKGTQ